MAEALARAGDEVHLVAPADPRERSVGYRSHPLSPLVKFRPRPSVSGLHLLERPFFDAVLALRLLGVVRRERIEVLHAHNHEGLAAALLARALLGVPVVYHAHNVAEDELPLYAPRLLRGVVRRAARLLDRILPRCADQVVVLSEDVGAHLVGLGVGPEQVAVVPPGLDATLFDDCEPQVRAPRVVFAGNLDEYQNLEFLFSAWDEVGRTLPDAELRIVTHARGGALARGRAQMVGGRVTVVEASNFAQVREELARARAGVSPRASWSGFPIKTLNYMAAGLPTIAVEGSAKGVVDGVTGWVVGDASVSAFASAMTEALSQPREAARRGRAARLLLQREHAWADLIPAIRAAGERARMPQVAPRPDAVTDQAPAPLPRAAS